MIKVYDKVIKTQNNFWNNCVFHPTDAIEDPWGKRIIDRMSEDKAINYIRIYSMFEDIVYTDGNKELRYDFRLNDLRIDYLLERGITPIIAYAAVPDCIADGNCGKSSVSKGKTRYKGKLWNTTPPKSEELWEEICFRYTEHLVERYGEDEVAKWYCHCFNEPDTIAFFMQNEEYDSEHRFLEYFKMYRGFVKGVRRASGKIKVGGPAIAASSAFLDRFLKLVKDNDVELNYLSIHFYGTNPDYLNSGEHGIGLKTFFERVNEKIDIIKNNDFAKTPIIIDEWGACSHGFLNKDECPKLMFRETEIFSAYFVRLIHAFVFADYNVEKLLICLSGQHEMTEDFSGFRNFFTKNYIKKPIYNAFILASKLGKNVLDSETDDPNITVLPTKTDNGKFAVLLTYAAEDLLKDVADKKETVEFVGDFKGKNVTVFAIDKTHTNPYRLSVRRNIVNFTEDEIEDLRREGELKPLLRLKGGEKVELELTANSTFLITVE